MQLYLFLITKANVLGNGPKNIDNLTAKNVKSFTLGFNFVNLTVSVILDKITFTKVRYV